MVAKATMRMSASINPGPHLRQSAFTLIEIMLVLVIIGVMVALVAISLSTNPASQVDREGQRLLALLTEASEEAVSQGWEIALAISGDSGAGGGGTEYQLMLLDVDAQRWKVPQQENARKSIWSRFEADEAIQFDLVLEGQQLSGQQLDSLARVRSLNTPEALRPSILMLSSGEITPFLLTLSYRGTDYSLKLSSDGVSGVFLQ